jgi:glucose/arabinose dehydrogenase
MKVIVNLVLLVILISIKSIAQLPVGFVEQTVYSSNTVIVGMKFDASARIYYWEKSGKVWVIKNGVRGTTPLIDLSAEVRDNWDAGLIGFALDPDYMSNGFFYLCYPVKENVLPGYVSTYQPASIGRVVKYQVTNPNDNYPVANLSTRLILVGETIQTGIPVLFEGHMGGALDFGDDGSLFVSTGDGSNFTITDNGNEAYYSTAITRGIIPSTQNIGSNRVQLLNSLNGKLLRINPDNGDGLADNPYYDAANPRAAASRIWAKGLRNPWKLLHVPNSGNHHDPGKFLIGDVGANAYEEINLSSSAGQNFGWPHYESDYFYSSRPSTYLPTTYQKPIIDARNTIRGLVNGTFYTAGSSQLPSNTTDLANEVVIVLGNFYTRNDVPSQYQNALFWGDYGAKKIYYTKFDSNWNPLFVNKFCNVSDFIFAIETNPITGGIYYASNPNTYGGASTIKRIVYAPGNRPPIAKIQADTLQGIGKLTTAFSAEYSYDPDNNPLTYSWNFGNGQTASGLSPHITFSTVATTIQQYKVKLTVSDNSGASAVDSVWVTLNNTIPKIENGDISNGLNNVQENTATPVTATATASDQQSAANLLTYTWKVYIIHNGHEHLEATYYGSNTTYNLPMIACESAGASYWLKVELKVTDPNGLSSVSNSIIKPDCGLAAQTITFNALSDVLTTTSTVAVSATASSGLPITYNVIEGPVTLLGTTATVLGIPGKVTIRATQHGSTAYNQADYVDRSFKILKPRTAQTIYFSAIANQQPPNATITMAASSSLGLPVSYVWVSGPATVLGNVITLTGQGGVVKVRAFNKGDDNINGAYSEQVFYACPLSWTLDNSNSITNGSTVLVDAQQTIVSTATVGNGSNVVYDAGQSITLNPGFSVASGSVFKTAMNGCRN